MHPWYTLLAASLSLVEGRAVSAPSCQDLVLPITASALNIALPTGESLSDLLTSNISALPTKAVSGTYQISARYCEPAKKVASRENTLQLLIHGITYTKDYWSSLGAPPNGAVGSQYSWVDYASQEGYPTLAFDRICNGQSSHPDGLLDCQIALNAAVINGVIEKARSGAVGGRKFSSIIPICHSVGSGMCQYLTQTNPTDANTPSTFILTGYTDHFIFVVAGGEASGLFVPALIDKPSETGSSDPNYLVSAHEEGFEGLVYFGDYAKSVANYDWTHRHTVTTGELATLPLSQVEAPDYAGSILVLNGQEDQVGCTVNPAGAFVGFTGQCGHGASSFSAQTGALFPSAKSYVWHQIPETGHDLNLHKTFPKTLKLAFDYLAAHGY